MAIHQPDAAWTPGAARGAARPLVIAHRGGAGLRPENTRAAFAHAVELGADGFELDVHLSRDGEVVVHHDFHLRACAARLDGRWLEARGPALRALRLEELRRYDLGRLQPDTAEAARHPEQIAVDGEPIPTLVEVLELARAARGGPRQLWIELKVERLRPWSSPPEDLTEAVVALLRYTGMAAHALLLCFDWSVLAHARRLAPEIARVHSLVAGAGGDLEPPSVFERIAAARGAVWFPEHSDVSADSVARARAAGLGVATWTADEVDEQRRLISLGVDAICTDHPDRLLALRATESGELERVV